jgi:hypothetical protein
MAASIPGDPEVVSTGYAERLGTTGSIVAM